MSEPILILVEKNLPRIFNVKTTTLNTQDKSLKIVSRISQLVSHKALVTHCRTVAEALDMQAVSIVLVDWEGKYLDGAKYGRGLEND